MKIRFLSKREINSLIEELNNYSLIIDCPKIKQIKSFELNNKIEVFHSDYFIIVKAQEHYFPFLKDFKTIDKLPKIIVDKGAIPFVCKGANIMRPGIKEIDDSFKQDDIIVISEELHTKNIAIGKSMYSSDEILNLEKGIVILNLHFVGDNIWNICKELNFSSIS